MKKKIIVCTTFRDFNGNTNDKIQRLFLQSLREQTYQDYILVATIFKEKNVEETLREMSIPYATYQGKTPECKFSLTEVFLNGLEVARQHPGSVIMWTTCDTIYDRTFFEKLAEIRDGVCGTSYPHTGYRTIDDFMKRTNRMNIWFGIDAIFFEESVFDEKATDAIRRYPNRDWGYFEFFLTGIGMVFAKRMINMRPSMIARIDNDFEAAGRKYEDVKVSCGKNAIELKRFGKDFGLRVSNKPYDWLVNYRIEAKSMRERLERIAIYVALKYITSSLRSAIVRLQSIFR